MAEISTYSFSCSIRTDKTKYGPREPVTLHFDLSSNNNCDMYVLTWHTPLEGLYNRYLTVTVGGEEVPYRGIMAKRGNPSADSYILLPAGGTVSGTVDICDGYSTEERGRYSVELSTRLMDVVERREEVDFVASELGHMKKVPIACGPVEFDVE